MSENCLNDGCFRPVAAGKRHDPLLDIPGNPYLVFNANTTTTNAPATTTTTTPYPQDILDLIHIPTSGRPCPIVPVTTTTTTSTTSNPTYTIGGLKCKFNMSSNSSETFEFGNVGISLPITNGIVLSNIDFSNVGNNFSFMAFGYFKPPINGPYTFYTTSFYRSAIWFNTLADVTNGRNSTNSIVYNVFIPNLETNPQKIASASRPLLATKYYPIRLIYSVDTGLDALQFSWSGPNIPETTNLSSYFYYPL